MMRRRALPFALALVTMWAATAAAQVLISPGANQSGVTVIQPTWEPPYRLTVRIYVSTQDGQPLPPPIGANLLVTDAQGRRVGMDAAGALHAEIPTARWGLETNPQPNAPVGPRGLLGTGITLDDAAAGPYVVEVAGTDRVQLDLAVAQWDSRGQRRWMHFLHAATEPGAVDRWDLPYTAAARPAFDLREQSDGAYSLDVTGIAAGAYDITVYLTDRAGQSQPPVEITGVPTRAGETHRYALQTTAPLRVGGAL